MFTQVFHKMLWETQINLLSNQYTQWFFAIHLPFSDKKQGSLVKSAIEWTSVNEENLGLDTGLEPSWASQSGFGV